MSVQVCLDRVKYFRSGDISICTGELSSFLLVGDVVIQLNRLCDWARAVLAGL